MVLSITKEQEKISLLHLNSMRIWVLVRAEASCAHPPPQRAQKNLSFFFFLFTAIPAAYGSSWAKAQIIVAAMVLHHSHITPDLSCSCDLFHSLWQCRILNPLSKVQDENLHPHQDHVGLLTCWATLGTAPKSYLVLWSPDYRLMILSFIWPCITGPSVERC